MTAAAPAVTRHVTWLRGPFPPRQLLALRCGRCGYVTDWHLSEHESHAAGQMRDHEITHHHDTN